MARKKRLNTAAVLNAESVVKPRGPENASTGYQAAAYVRLSTEDSGKLDGYSLQNQKDLLMSFIREHSDLHLYKMYVDNGFTGTNFQRPAFEEMMDDIQAGHVNCVLVKDLSRLGRNYLEAGNYLEQVFPFFQVRFIAITERYDSISPDFTNEALIIPLKNIINECYAKDISIKVSSAIATRKKQGKYMGKLPVYGYLKDPKDKNHLIIDPDTAPIVQRIFQMATQEITMGRIAKQMNEESIPCPSRYFVLKGISREEKYLTSLWSRYTVKQILSNRMYLGCTVYGKTVQSIAKGIRNNNIPEMDWQVVENTHEPLITADLFQQAQKKLEAGAQRYRAHDSYAEGQVDNLFRGMIRCGTCAGAMRMSKFRKYHKNGAPYFYGVYECCRHKLTPNHGCPQKGIRKDKLDQVVMEAIRYHIQLFPDSESATGRLLKKHSPKPDPDTVLVLIRHYSNFTEPDHQIVQTFVSQIRVYSTDRIEIQFRFADEPEKLRRIGESKGAVL